jgi:hypothetical protein
MEGFALLKLHSISVSGYGSRGDAHSYTISILINGTNLMCIVFTIDTLLDISPT